MYKSHFMRLIMLSQTHLSNWGNSQAIRIPKKVLNKLNLTKD